LGDYFEHAWQQKQQHHHSRRKQQQHQDLNQHQALRARHSSAEKRLLVDGALPLLLANGTDNDTDNGTNNEALPNSVVPQIAGLLDAGYKVLVYNGDRDLSCCVQGTEQCLDGMQWSGAGE
jgi:hypothetical protein